jgi:uncharacterized DUF497 family protein
VSASVSGNEESFKSRHRLDSEDTRRDYSEERRLTLGKIEGRLFAVAYTRAARLSG